jgi:hypothetical protein
MALKARITKAIYDALNDTLKAEYKEDGDDFVLDVTAVGGYALENIEGLRNTLSKLKAENAASKKILKEFEVDGEVADPAQVHDLLKKFKEMGNLTPEQLAETKVKSALDQQQAQFNKQIKAKDDTVTSMRSHLEKVLIDQAATAVLASKGGNIKLLLPHVKSALKVIEENGEFGVKVIGADGNPRVSVARGQTSDMTLEQLVEELAGSEDFSMAFTSQSKPGGGTPPSKPGSVNGGAVKKVAASDLGNFSLEDIAAGKVTVAG